jgi:hypothetical protein
VPASKKLCDSGEKENLANTPITDSARIRNLQLDSRVELSLFIRAASPGLADVAQHAHNRVDADAAGDKYHSVDAVESPARREGE